MIRVLVAVACMMCVGLTSPAQGKPREPLCGATAGFREAAAVCDLTANQTRDLFASSDGHSYTVTHACAVGGQATCLKADDCLGEDQTPGLLYDVFQDGQPYGQVCLSDSDVTSLGQVTPGLVRKAFERLTWPSSELTVQPPDGVTLVGFESNFFTTNTTLTTQTVTLLGKRIQIEATPTSYIWHFGDESPAA